MMKWAVAIPLLVQVGWQEALGTGWAKTAKISTDNIYTRLGVRPFINGRGNWTYTGSSMELPEVRAAMDAAARHFVNIFELQNAVGRRLAELTGAEAGMVTAGAAAAMACGTCACIAGSDPDRIWQLPDTTGMKSEVVMVGGRSVFDNAIRLAGGKLVLVDNLEQLANALNHNTAMVYTVTYDREKLVKEIAIAKKAGVPIFKDASGEVPPIATLRELAAMGPDLYTFSGGKGLCAPQCTGLLLGRKDLIEAALYNSNPWDGATCRPMKVGTEEIVGCLVAVETWFRMDQTKLDKEWNDRASRIKKFVDTVPGVTSSIVTPTDRFRYPTITIDWDQEAWGYTTEDCAEQLLEGTPSIVVLTNSNPEWTLTRPGAHRSPKEFPDSQYEGIDRLQIVSGTLQPGEDIIVAKRLRQLLSAARARHA